MGGDCGDWSTSPQHTKYCPAKQQPDSGIGRPDGILKTVPRQPHLKKETKTKVLRHRASGGEIGEKKKTPHPGRVSDDRGSENGSWRRDALHFGSGGR